MRALLDRPFGRGHHMLRNRLTTFLLLAATALLLAACTTPTDGLLATQGFGHFNAKSVSFDLGSGGSSLRTMGIDTETNAPLVLVSGSAAGLGKDGHTVEVTASGTPLVLCRNGGASENPAPGQNPVTVVGGESGDVVPSSKGGKFIFLDVASTIDPADIEALLSNPFPCANDNWTASLDFVFWDYVRIDLIEDATGIIADTLEYECVTTRQPLVIECERIK